MNFQMAALMKTKEWPKEKAKIAEWLDEDEDDGKLERVVKQAEIQDEKSKEDMWERDGWKFQPGSQMVLTSVASGKCLRLNADEDSIKADGEEMSDCILTLGQRGDESSRIFSSNAQSEICHITLDEGNVTIQKGNAGLLSEFLVEVLPNRNIILKSVVHNETYLSVTPSGSIRGGSRDEGESIQFSVFVKGVLRNLGRIKLHPVKNGNTIIAKDGSLYGDGTKHDEEGEFVVHKVGRKLRAFQSATSDKFLRITSDGIDCQGKKKSDPACQFKLHRNKPADTVKLESRKMPGVFVGVVEHGKVKPAVDNGDQITELQVEIVCFGTPKQESQSLDAADEIIQRDNESSDHENDGKNESDTENRENGYEDEFESDNEDHEKNEEKSSRSSADFEDSKNAGEDNQEKNLRPSSNHNMREEEEEEYNEDKLSMMSRTPSPNDSGTENGDNPRTPSPEIGEKDNSRPASGHEGNKSRNSSVENRSETRNSTAKSRTPSPMKDNDTNDNNDSRVSSPKETAESKASLSLQTENVGDDRSPANGDEIQTTSRQNNKINEEIENSKETQQSSSPTNTADNVKDNESRTSSPAKTAEVNTSEAEDEVKSVADREDDNTSRPPTSKSRTETKSRGELENPTQHEENGFMHKNGSRSSLHEYEVDNDPATKSRDASPNEDTEEKNNENSRAISAKKSITPSPQKLNDDNEGKTNEKSEEYGDDKRVSSAKSGTRNSSAKRVNNSRASSRASAGRTSKNSPRLMKSATILRTPSPPNDTEDGNSSNDENSFPPASRHFETKTAGSRVSTPEASNQNKKDEQEEVSNKVSSAKIRTETRNSQPEKSNPSPKDNSQRVDKSEVVSNRPVTKSPAMSRPSSRKDSEAAEQPAAVEQERTSRGNSKNSLKDEISKETADDKKDEDTKTFTPTPPKASRGPSTSRKSPRPKSNSRPDSPQNESIS